MNKRLIVDEEITVRPGRPIVSPQTTKHTQLLSRRQLESLLGLFLPLTLVALMIYFATQSSAFLTPDNLRGVAVQSAATIVIVVPFALLLMSGGVDLSVGSTIALSGVVAGLLFPSFPVWFAVAAALLCGLAIGLTNGIFVIAGMSPFIVTLGTLSVGRGLAQVLAPVPVFGFPTAIIDFGAGSFLDIPYLVWITIFMIILGMFVLNMLPIGKHIVAVGENPRAAYLVGLPVKRIRLSLYAATGVASAIAGIMLISRYNSAPSGTLGVGTELVILTAVLLGGVPFAGGRGAIWRVVVGVLLLGVLRNGTTLLNITPQASLVITGAVLIVAAALEIMRQRLFRRE